MKLINNSFNKSPNKEIKETLNEKELDTLILENTNKLISIKAKYDEIKSNWKALKEDMESLSMYNRVNCGEDIKEQFQKAIDDLKMDYRDTKATLDTYKAQKNKLLLEDTLSEDPMIDESEEIIDHLQDIIDTSDIYEVFKYLYDKLVPKAGPSNTVAGEIIRALMAIMNGVLRNNQVFYDGEGKDKFGSAFYYLTSKGYTDILEDAIGLTGDEYISTIEKAIDKIARDFIYNPELLKTQNMEDYTQFTPIIQEIDEDCGTKKEFKEAFHPSYEELQNGDEIIVGGQHLYVADAEYDDDYVWVTDEKEDRYNKRAPGNTLNKCLIDEVIGQPDEEELDESLKESSNKDDKLKKINTLYRDAIGYGIDRESLDKILYSNGADPNADTFDVGLDVDKAYEELSDFLRKKYQSQFDRDYDNNEIPYDSYNILGFNKAAYKLELERLNKEIANLKDKYAINENKKELSNMKFLKENLSTRKEMIDWIEDHWNDTIAHGEWLYNYLTELGFNIEDDSDAEEGFYANITTSDLRKIVDKLKSNTKSSVKDQIADIREALETLGRVSDVSLDYTGAEEATFDVNLKDGDTFRIQIYKM